MQSLKISLPNFPNDVLEEWLLPLARRLGWPPPTPLGPWASPLMERPLNFWRSVTWTLEQRPLTRAMLSSRSDDIIRGLHDAYINMIPNDYSRLLGESGRDRFYFALAFLSEHGVFPKAIAVLEENGRLTILDGSHRVTAYFAYEQMLSEPSLRANLSPGSVPLRPLQPMWVARLVP